MAKYVYAHTLILESHSSWLFLDGDPEQRRTRQAIETVEHSKKSIPFKAGCGCGCGRVCVGEGIGLKARLHRVCVCMCQRVDVGQWMCGRVCVGQWMCVRVDVRGLIDVCEGV